MPVHPSLPTGTNINDSILHALSYLHDQEAAERDNIPMIIFMTDGEPTSGETNGPTILNNIRESNQDGVAIFSLAFGDDVDFAFMQRLSAQNGGSTKRIYENADHDDVVAQFSGFYDEVSTPVLSDVIIDYPVDTVDETTITNSYRHTYFDGSEIVVAGELLEGAQSIAAVVSGEGATGKLRLNLTTDGTQCAHCSEGKEGNQWESEKYIQKMWAFMTIKELLTVMKQTENENIKKLARGEIIRLSLKVIARPN